MSEAMAIEEMAEGLAKLLGYHTKTNVPYLRTNADTNRPSDIDVLCSNGDDEILAVECKSTGGPAKYENWNKQSRLSDIEDELTNLTSIDKILDAEFEGVEQVDTIWFVFKGYFATEPSGRASVEKDGIESYEDELEDEFGFTVSIKPSHVLIQELIDQVSQDMMNRRTRYPTATMELFRQLVAIAGQKPEEIENIKERLLGSA